MSLAAEAKLGALLNAKEAVYTRQILTKMGHPQPPMPIQTNNLMAEGVVNIKVQPKRTKLMDMRYHWLRNQEAQAQFRFIGSQEKPIWQTISPSITHQHITEMCGKNF
jgi:hypothetical protein